MRKKLFINKNWTRKVFFCRFSLRLMSHQFFKQLHFYPVFLFISHFNFILFSLYFRFLFFILSSSLVPKLCHCINTENSFHFYWTNDYLILPIFIFYRSSWLYTSWPTSENSNSFRMHLAIFTRILGIS